MHLFVELLREIQNKEFIASNINHAITSYTDLYNQHHQHTHLKGITLCSLGGFCLSAWVQI